MAAAITDEDQDLGADEELDHQQETEPDTHRDRPAAPAEQSSSRQSTTSGGTGAMPSIRWASVRLDEDERREAVEEAADEGGGRQATQRRSSTNMASADSAGPGSAPRSGWPPGRRAR